MTERISLDGQPVMPERFVRAYDELAPYLDLVDQRHDHRLSFFEVLTAMAYATFADAPVDAAIIEVGMGGSWDATNVADAKVAVVTPISLDHVEYLGDTVGDIATEKAGIIKPGSLAVTGRAAERGGGCPACAAPPRWGPQSCGRESSSACGAGRSPWAASLSPWRGSADRTRSSFCRCTVPTRHRTPRWRWRRSRGSSGVAGCRSTSTLVRLAFGRIDSPGRLEVLRRAPTIIVDAAHNPAGARALASAIQDEFHFASLVAVVAVLSDKDAVGILEALEPVVDHVVVTENSSPRAMPLDDLAELALRVMGQERVNQAQTMPDAIDVAVGLADRTAGHSGAGVLVTGSVVSAGDARRLLKGTS